MNLLPDWVICLTDSFWTVFISSNLVGTFHKKGMRNYFAHDFSSKNIREFSISISEKPEDDTASKIFFQVFVNFQGLLNKKFFQPNFQYYHCCCLINLLTPKHFSWRLLKQVSPSTIKILSANQIPTAHFFFRKIILQKNS